MNNSTDKQNFGAGLPSLEQHNANMLGQHIALRDNNNRNGIACPECGDELFDDGSVVLASLPPQTKVFCKRCEFRGSRC
jgi:hypothetical protein